MKKIITIAALCTLTLSALAQTEMAVEVQRSMSQGNQYGLQIEIPEATVKVAQASWEKFVKEYKGKTKYNKKTIETFTDNANVADISSNTVDIYMTIAEFKAENKVVASFWFDLGGNYLNSKDNPEKFKTAQNIINTYAKKVKIAMGELALAEQEKILKGLNAELKNLEKQNEKYHTKIAEAEKLIKEMNMSINSNLDDQASKNEEIKAQQNKVNTAQAKIAKINS